MIEEVIERSIGELQLQRELQLMRTTEYPIILFGAGCTSEFVIEQFHLMGIYPRYFLDNSKDKIGKRIAGIEVLSPECVSGDQNSLFYITTQLFYREIKEQLIGLGISEKQIMQCDCIFQFPWEKQIISYLKKNSENLQKLYDKFQDKKSKLVLENRIEFLITRKRSYMSDIHEDIQYFDNSILEINDIKNYIDIGTYTGDTIIQFCSLNHCYENIWGFEPDKELYQTAINNLSQYNRISIVPYATSDFDGVMQVESGLGKMQTIDNQYAGTSYSDKMFRVCSLDSYFKNFNLNSCFVKMDIEGAELATLRGMREFIKRNRPTLAVCIYHKKEDILDIPELLDTYNVGYKYYFRHYSDNQTETVLFAKAEEIENE